MRSQGFKATRIGAISDGVFAIAMTLLVLNLKLPELQAPVSGGAFRDAVFSQWPYFVSWLISFAILGRLWLTHHALVEHGERLSRACAAMNFAFLGAISFIPFPTSLISEHADQPLSVIIFSATCAAAALALAGIYLLLGSSGTVSEDQRQASRSVKRVAATILLIALLACLLTLIDARLGIVVWVAVPFIGISLRRRKAHGNGLLWEPRNT